ncbi:MAG: phage tail protein [Oceanicaulis sp.]
MTLRLSGATLLAACALFGAAGPASANPDPFLGEVQLTANSFCPEDWAEANGQLLSIQTNTALFSLLGTYYGGNGVQTFALPDLRGRAIVNWGNAPGIGNYVIGQMSGTPETSLLLVNMPPHNHPLNASNREGTINDPANADIAEFETRQRYTPSAPTDATFGPGVVGVTGGGQPFSIMQPSLAMRYCVALQGLYPSRG